MTRLLLHTATVDNAGQRRGAGEVIEVGDAPQQIAADRAALLVARSAALPVPDRQRRPKSA